MNGGKEKEEIKDGVGEKEKVMEEGGGGVEEEINDGGVMEEGGGGEEGKNKGRVGGGELL